MINGYGCFLKYLAVKSHFLNEKYDYFKYQGRTRADIRTFQNRKDKYYFEKLGKVLKTEGETERFFVSNFVFEGNLWVGDALQEGCQNNYVHWKKRIQSMRYIFKKDLTYLTEQAEELQANIKELFQSKDGQHPLVLKMFLKKKLTIESLVILNSFFHFFDRWDETIKDKTLWPEIRKRCLRYEPFLFSYLNKEQVRSMKKIVKDKFLID